MIGLTPPFFVAYPDLCMVALWGFGLGFVFIYCPIFAKLYRLHRIYYSNGPNVVKISNTKLLLLVAIVIVTEIVLLVIWSFIDPCEQGFNITNYQKFPVCSSNTVTFFSIQFISMLIIMIMGLIISFRVRKIKLDTINEVDEVFHASIFFTLITILVGPISIFFSQYPGPLFGVILTIGLFMLAMTTLLSLFFRKVYRVFRGKGDTQAEPQYPSNVLVVIDVDTKNNRRRYSRKSKKTE